MTEDKNLLTYNYKKFGDFIRPIIYVDIHYKTKSRSTFALIDSGADNCIFHAELGELLGIDVKSGESREIGGIASDKDGKPKPIIGYWHKIGITIKGQTRTIHTFFSYDISDLGYGVLGQIGFFDKFTDITFDYNNHKIRIRV